MNVDTLKKTWEQLESWYQTDLGIQLYKQEREVVLTLLDGCFGFNAVQLGNFLDSHCIDQLRVTQKCLVSCHQSKLNSSLTSNQRSKQNSINTDDSGVQQIISLFELLSFKNNSVDVVVLFHSLEFSIDPHAILREVDRILVAEGKLIIIGFNPYSLFGLWRFSLRLKQKFIGDKSIIPSQTKLISFIRLQDWLSLLGFTSQEKIPVFFRPPINSVKVLDKLKFMEKTGKTFWPFLSTSYIFLSIKRVSTLTPIKTKWLLKKKRIGEVTSETSVQPNIHSKTHKIKKHDECKHYK